MPSRTYIYSISVSNYTIRTNDTETEYPCGFAFVAADDSYNFSIADLKGYDLRGTNLVPSVLDWSVGNQTCEEVAKESTTFLCSTNSFCKNPNYDWTGYLCQCSLGYRGNPYLPNGCRDVNECMESIHECVSISKCVNTDGGYNCSCPKGYRGDGRQNGERCIDIDECDNPELNDCKGQCINRPGSYSCSSQNSSAINVGIVAMVVVIIGSTFLFWGLRKRKLIKLKEKFFEQNGRFLLQQLVEQKELTSHMIKIFSAEELQKATKNYDDSLIAGRGGFGTVYKRTLPDGSLVAIKKSKQTDIDIDKAQVQQFISEVVILCQVNNRNIVHMLGCCLETPSPILVYEFVSNGTLYEHLHDKGRKSLSWETRLKIATQTAGVLSYLHSQAVTPIIHKDIKSTNILLDENFNAKVSDFGASKLIASNEMQVYTLVQGTLGYLDPEYLQTSQLTEKSDVYSFGVLLVELLTGQKVIRFNKPEAEKSLANYFLYAVQENRLVEVLEPRVVEEGSVELLHVVADIARFCLRLKGEERPSMKQVAIELEGLRNMGVGGHFSPWNGEELHYEEESVYLLDEGAENNDSIRNQDAMSIPTGR
ncbi:hypothetical protein ACJIZ3_009191 [Penstemon smallii]|uniref:Uncharacterized protein n=1 Tax=Penstemon smallii TaxID=265156 RepID=A0ABD3TBU8_9LAMI